MGLEFLALGYSQHRLSETASSFSLIHFLSLLFIPLGNFQQPSSPFSSSIYSPILVERL